MNLQFLAPMLAFTDADQWRPGIGDPTFVGWFTVVAYFAAALGALKAARSSTKTGFSGQISGRTFWGMLCALLVVLGINKQLDLQTWVTLTFRHLAMKQGWYGERRALQMAFIAGIGIAVLAASAGAIWFTRRQLREFAPALVGLFFLGGFVLVRAASFHHVDQLLLSEIGGLRLNWILELTGVFWVGFAAWRAARRHRLAVLPSQNFVWVTAGDRL